MRGSKLPLKGDEWLNIRNGAISIPERYSEELRTLITKMMSRSINLRPSAQEIISDIIISEKQKKINELSARVKELEKRLFPAE